MSINIEITLSPDAEKLSAIHRACFRKGWGAQAVRDLLSTSTTAAALAGDYAGFGLIRHSGDHADILTIAVLPEHRRQGLARALTRAVCDWAAARGVSGIFLEVRQSNQPAITLYRTLGFSKISLRKEYYGNEDGSREDAAVMRYTP